MTDEQQVQEFWQRAARLGEVSFPARTIELIVMPYETAARVPYQGRMVDETIARGAFDGIERRANRIRVNREHRREDTVGRAVAFHPTRQEGLVAEVRIANTERGTETLELAADGCLDASAAFLPMAGGMRWDGPNEYTVTKAWLGHIALTSEPAYEDARVLDVRTAAVITSSTPLLDEFRALLAADRLATLAGE